MTEQLKIDLGPVYLRPITLEDTENIVKWRNTDRVRKNFIYQKPFTKEGHLAWMRDKVAAGEVVQFILCETEGDRPVGSVYFRDIASGNKKAEYGIFIGEEDAAGKGYGTLAGRAAIQYAGNTAAVRSYEKAGFEKEALLGDEIKTGDGYRDLILMARLYPENR